MMRSVLNGAAAGAAAGAAGTTALNAVTYLDMAVRGRPASQTPEETVKRLSEVTHIPVPGPEEKRSNRISGIGPLLGIGTGVGVGALYGMVRASGWKPRFPVAALAVGTAAMVNNAPVAALGVSDPRTWRVSDWIADIVPHLAYGAVTAAVVAAEEDHRRPLMARMAMARTAMARMVTPRMEAARKAMTRMGTARMAVPRIPLASGGARMAVGGARPAAKRVKGRP